MIKRPIPPVISRLLCIIFTGYPNHHSFFSPGLSLRATKPQWLRTYYKAGQLGLSAILFYDELVAKCKRGDVQSYETLYRQYAKPMYNTSLRIVNNASDAEDVLQESFASAFQHLDRFDYSSTFGAWLKRIVVNNSINVLRKRKLAFIDISESSAGDMQETELPDEENIQLKVAAIKKAMAHLPNGYRSVLSLLLFEGYDYEETGEILNISPSTVRTQYHRAKQKLLHTLKQETSDE